MAVMGEQPAEVWVDELRRRGRVVFPLRRRRLMVMPGIIVLLFASKSAASFVNSHDEGGWGPIIEGLALAGWLTVAGALTWMLITQRPQLIVDHEGIRHGRKRFLPWTEIGTIGLPHGPRFHLTLPIIPTNVWAKHLTLGQENVRDLQAFAHWLEDVLKQHRTAQSGNQAH
ncbi:hypothetical protein [Kribbella swartbergensis]